VSTTLTVSYGAQYTDIGSRRHPSYAIAPRPRTAATRAEKVSGGKFFVGEVSNGRRTERLVGGLGAQRTRSSREFFPDRIRRGTVADCRALRRPCAGILRRLADVADCAGFSLRARRIFPLRRVFVTGGVFVTGVGFRDEVLTRAVENANEIARECGGDFKYIQAKMLRPRRRLNRRCIPSVHTTRIQRTYGRRRD
jgi:hypothetical protein